MNSEKAFVLKGATGECVVSVRSETQPELTLWLRGQGACQFITGKEALEALSEAISHALGRLDFREVWEKAVRCETEMERFAQEACDLEKRLDRAQRRLERVKAGNARDFEKLMNANARVASLECGIRDFVAAHRECLKSGEDTAYVEAVIKLGDAVRRLEEIAGVPSLGETIMKGAE